MGGGGGPRGGTDPCSEGGSWCLPPPPQSARRWPLLQPLRRRVAGADTGAADTVVVDTVVDTAAADTVESARMAGLAAPTPWGAASAALDCAGAGSRLVVPPRRGGSPSLVAAPFE